MLCFWQMNKPASHSPSPDEKIHGHGLRMTDQRRAVYDVLMGKRDHPTAVEVFTRVRRIIAARPMAIPSCFPCPTAARRNPSWR